MTFFDTIGGCKYETQTSAVLNYLFINSNEFRQLFTKHIEHKFPKSRVPSFANGVLGNCEVGRKGVGRIDLLIESDNCFLAIENKIWARFESNQPAKYSSIVEEKSAKKFNGDATCYRLIVIAPSQRNGEIEKHLEKQKKELNDECIVVTWQNIQEEMLRKLEGKASRRVQVVAELLDEFIEQQIGKHADLDFDRSKLLGKGATITNQFQSDFLYNLKSSFSDFNLSRMGFGKGTYAGFYFSHNWFGFHSSPSGTILQLHAKLDRLPEIEIANWKIDDLISKKQRVHFTFLDETAEWPRSRAEWQSQIQPVIDCIKQHTGLEQEAPDEDDPPDDSR